MKTELSDDEIISLLAEASDAFPDSDFVESVGEWYEEHGFITEAQEDALNNIVENRHGHR